MSGDQEDSHLVLSEELKESGVSGDMDSPSPIGDQAMCALERAWGFSSAVALKERSRSLHAIYYFLGHNS